MNALDLAKVGKAFGFTVPPRVNISVGGAGKTGAGKKRKRRGGDDDEGSDDEDGGNVSQFRRRDGNKDRRMETLGKSKVGKEVYKRSREKPKGVGDEQWSR